MSRVLILHDLPSHSDLVRRVATILRADGHDATLLDEEIQLGTSIVEKIESEIRAAEAVIVITTKGSPSIFYELGLLTALRRPFLLLANERVGLLPDLMRFLHIRFDSKSAKSEEFAFKLRSQLRTFLQQTSRRSFHSDIKPSNIETVESKQPLEITSFNQARANGAAFENWVNNLANRVSGWDVLTRPQSTPDKGYDLAIWNNISDPILQYLGNPIVFQFKLSELHLRDVVESVRLAQKSNLTCLVLVTASTPSRSVLKEISSTYKKNKVFTVLLDADDLEFIESPYDFVDLLRSKVSRILISGASSV